MQSSEQVILQLFSLSVRNKSDGWKELPSLWDLAPGQDQSISCLSQCHIICRAALGRYPECSFRKEPW